MSEQMTDTEVRTAVTVEAPIEHAFEVFTQRLDAWWPRDYKMGQADLEAVVLEPDVGGRWYELGVDGSDCDWGRVLEWDPPNHVAMSWNIDFNWQYDPDPAKASRVDVRFTATGPTTTEVELVHSQLDRHGAGFEKIFDAVCSENGWSAMLRTFAAAAAV